jgi:predicted nucleic acid-binding protein
MEETQKRVETIVLNSNILFSSLIKEEGFTRAVLLFLKETMGLKFLIPEKVVQEFETHIGEIARKSGMDTKQIRFIFEKLLEKVEIIKEENIKEEIKQGLKYVKDESDSPFVGIALKFKPSNILTYNKKHYKVGELKQQNIFVITPKEALDSIGIEKLSLETKEKRKRNLISYLAKLKMFMKK